MKNRKLSSPILCAIVLSLVVDLPLSSWAQTVAPAPAANPVPATTAPVTAATTTTAPAKSALTPAHTISYTVVAGDTLTSLARKFNTTRRHLTSLNDLSSTKLKPGQVLLIPSTKKTGSTATATTSAKTKAKHSYAIAQPVQDFDVPASTFGSCPVPLPSPDDDAQPSSTASSDENEKPAPIAKLVSPAEIAAEEAKMRKTAALAEMQAQDKASATAPKSVPQNTNSLVATSPKPNRPSGTSTPGIFAAPLPGASTLSTQRLNPHNLSTANLTPSRSLNPYLTTTTGEWADRFLRQARLLGDQGIEYNDDWRPPGENRSWVMDCSNTARYLYKVTAGILLPRTASDQYYYLHLQGKAWDVPQLQTGWADTNFLRDRLKPGDLLFWENTYRPERQPPITHVMVFLGTNDRGQWIMAGSQGSRGGEHNRRNGGPDIYVFRPNQPCGGYTTWMGLVHHQGRFCAYGRPLDADRTKLTVASDN